MKMTVSPEPVASRGGAYAHRLAWLLAVQFAAALLAIVAVALYPSTLLAALVLVAAVTVLVGLALWRAWRPVGELARLLRDWRDDDACLDALRIHAAAQTRRGDLADLSMGVHGFATRLADYGRRERDFTRDASHELRTPLTVIRMAVDRLAGEDRLGDAGQRSVRRIHRATRELEALVEVMLILAREYDPGCYAEHFVVNDILHRELDAVRDLMEGSAVELELEEPAQFALHGSVRAFSVLCWQLIRDACQRAGDGRVLISVQPATIIVSHEARCVTAPSSSSEQPSFELAIAQRISDRFAWPLELRTQPGQLGMARVSFPKPLPVVA